VEPIGKIKKISVAVIVDGIYKLVKGEKGGKDWKYFPRSQEDMSKLENIVKRAVSFDPERGDQLEVINIPFEGKKARLAEGEAAKHVMKKVETPWLSGLKKHMPLMTHVFLGFSLLLSFIFVARPLIKWLTSISIKDLDISNKLPMTVGEAERQFGRRKGLPFTDKAAQMIARDKENSVELMRGWLNER
jgi:flagellar M-ring protein FliF